MAFKLPKNVVSKNNMKNILYLVTLALAVAYLMNRENIALISLVVVAGTIYMLKKDVVIALGVSIVVTNLLLAMNFFKSFEGLENKKQFSEEDALKFMKVMAQHEEELVRKGGKESEKVLSQQIDRLKSIKEATPIPDDEPVPSAKVITFLKKQIQEYKNKLRKKNSPALKKYYQNEIIINEDIMKKINDHIKKRAKTKN